MLYSDYVDFFRDKVVNESALFSTSGSFKNHFGRWVPSSNPFFPDAGLEEFIGSVRTSMQFPYLLLQAPISKVSYRSSNFAKDIHGSFIIIVKIDHKNDRFDNMQEAMNTAEAVGNQIIMFMTAYAIKNPNEFFFDPNSVEYEPVQPTKDLIGMRYNFTMVDPYMSNMIYNPNLFPSWDTDAL